MALGFGFNKTKVMQSAERFVLQGKISSAVAEYEKVIAHDPRDLTVLNTLGDLYARTGRGDDALQCFRKVAEAYAADGFALKAIAMYKKISKINPHSLECIMKLGELYSLQGLFSEARAQYVAAAEHQISRGDSEAAAGVYHKALELDPENAHMQQRLAELYLSSGKKEEAADVYIMAAQSLHMRGRHPAALDILEKLLKVLPKHAAALVLCGKVASESGDHARAISNLEKLPDLDQRPDALRQLIRARLASSDFEAAEQDAHRLLHTHNDSSGAFSVAEAMIEKSAAEPALRLLNDAIHDEVLAQHSAEVARVLKLAINQGKDNVPVLEAALQLNRRIADRASVGELVEQLAQAYVQADELERAHALYNELAELEPDNALHQKTLAHLASRISNGEGVQPEADKTDKTPEAKKPAEETKLVEDSVPVDDAPAPPAAAPQKTEYSHETVQAIETALTDAELFQSYNSPARAIEVLEAVLPKAPREVALNQFLSNLYVKAERYLEAAERFAVLREVFEADGLADEAQQAAAMEQKYRERGGGDPGPKATAAPKVEANAPVADLNASSNQTVTESSAEVESAGTPEREPQSQGEAHASGWDELAKEEEHGEPGVQLADPNSAPVDDEAFAEILEEARFYLMHGLRAEADGAIRYAEQLRPGSAEVAQVRAEFVSSEHDAPASEIQSHQPKASGENAQGANNSVDEAVLAIEAAADELSQEATAPPAKGPDRVLDLGLDELDKPAPAGRQAQSENTFDLGAQLDSSLPSDVNFGKKAPGASASKSAKKHANKNKDDEPRVAVTPAPQSSQSAGQKNGSNRSSGSIEGSGSADPFGEIFEEFRSSVEEPEGDLEQHYNLGIAMKDMGLLDEAVGELQTVCNALERGAEFADAVQAYTWLGHCLVERGAPQAAVRWYKRALDIPDLDPESQVAIHYELGLAYEKAGVRRDALQHFMEAYGSNIDYRDVAERIEALRG
jgi:tetratricopeptide (TPR) repeat protein